MSNDEVNDFLMGGGAPAAKFETIGTVRRGTILEATVTQQTDYDTGVLLFWKDDTPRNQVVITIQTDDRDPEIEDDDGKRRLFVKGFLQEAVRDAVRKSGAKRMDVGGTLAVQYVDDGIPKNVKHKKPKLYAAEYRPPAVNVDSLIGGDTPVAAGNPLIP